MVGEAATFGALAEAWASRLFQTGGYAAASGSARSSRSSEAKAGYHTRNVAASSPLSVRVRACRRRCAPSGIHRMCCFLTIRLLTTWLTVDSTNALEIVSPHRYR